MSSKKSKLDLLVRVRYSNPLPAPPCPPKLLNIPTNSSRYTNVNFTSELANSTPLPMVIDADCGMPIDLLQWECLWMENGDDSELNPDPKNLPPLDPKDAYLIAESSAAVNGLKASSSSSNIHHVPWLRKTEYISRETTRPVHTPELKMHAAVSVDISPEAQISNIEKSFKKVNEDFDLSKLDYPGKPHLKAVDSWEVFPDADIWANAYDLFKFSERPGDRPIEQEDPRLDHALLRPMESEGEHFLAYYLLKDEDAIPSLEEQRTLAIESDNPEPSAHTVFQFVRDYETVKIEQDIANEFILVFQDDEDADEGLFEDTSKRPKAAYYKNIERKINLKKKRVNKYEAAYSDKWDAIQLSHTPFLQEELDEREEQEAEVKDPLFMFRTDEQVEEPDEEPDVVMNSPKPEAGGIPEAD